MFAIKLFFCSVAAFAIFTKADEFYSPADGIKFTCSEVCYGHLRGKTYSCDMYSPEGTVTAVVRMIMDLNWRFYVISRLTPESRFCRKVADADNYFSNGKSSCSSSNRFHFRSNSENSHPIDPSTLQSNLRLEDMTRLLKAINNDTAEVLNDLKTPTDNKGLRFNQRKLKYPMKIQIKILIEKLVDHLSQAGQLNDDIKYHGGSDSSNVYTGFPNSPGFPGLSSFPNFPNRPSPLPGKIAKYKNGKVPTNSHTFNYTEHNTQTVKNHNHHNALYDSTNYYDHEVAYDTSNTYNIDSNNDKFTSYNDARNYGTKLSFQKHGKRAEKTPKIKEVKELASNLTEESTELLNALENGSLAKDPEKKKRKFGFLLKLLSGLMTLVNHQHWYEDDIYFRAEGNIGGQDSKNYPKMRSQLVGKSNKRKFTHDTSDEHGECLLCTMILKDLCKDGSIVVCNDSRCCWKNYNPYHCMSALNDKRAVTCYNSLFNILKQAKM